MRWKGRGRGRGLSKELWCYHFRRKKSLWSIYTVFPWITDTRDSHVWPCTLDMVVLSGGEPCMEPVLFLFFPIFGR